MDATTTSIIPTRSIGPVHIAQTKKSGSNEEIGVRHAILQFFRALALPEFIDATTTSIIRTRSIGPDHIAQTMPGSYEITLPLGQKHSTTGLGSRTALFGRFFAFGLTVPRHRWIFT